MAKINLKLVTTGGKNIKKSTKNKIEKLLSFVNPFFFTIKLVKNNDAKSTIKLTPEINMFASEFNQFPSFKAQKKNRHNIIITTIV